VPSVMVLMAMILSFATIQLDTVVAGAAPDWLSWLFDNQPQGAREVLSTIAGSMITVAGVVFSITLVAVSNAAYRLSPRLLTNFMRDVSNQVTLGTFISTFIYCLMVLRAVQSAPAGQQGDEASAFVPHLALLLAIALAVCSIAVLIYFIHHIPRSIHVSSVVADIGTDLKNQLASLFPRELGAPTDAEIGGSNEKAFRERLLAGEAGVIAVPSTASGYLRIMDTDDLMEIAEKKDLEIQLLVQPGEFLNEGDAVMTFRRADGAKPDKALTSKLQETFTLGAMRTPMQDANFLAQELSEIAMRALSPGINDPVSAISALNWLGSGLAYLGGRESIKPLRKDSKGRDRILSPVITFESLVENSLVMIAPDFARNLPAARAYLTVTSRLARGLPTERRAVIEKLQTRFKKITGEALPEKDVEEMFSEPVGGRSAALARARNKAQKFLSLFSF